MPRVLLTAAFLFALLLTSCQTCYSLVVLKGGPRTDLTVAEQRQILAGHFANMRRLARAQQLLVAGPFTEPRREGNRGLFVFATGDRVEAEALTSTDPGVLAGIFVAEHHALQTDSDLGLVRERELALDAEAERQGRQREPGEGCRHYVLLQNGSGAAMERALAPLRAQGKVVLQGRLDRTRGFAILDADKPETAEALLAEVRPLLGEYILDPWFASGELARLGSK